METIIACGVKRNCAKLISVKTAEVIYDFKNSHHTLDQHPVTVVDYTPLGKLSLIGTSDGQIHLNSILIGADDESDSD